MGRKKPSSVAQAERSFELEEELDLAALGFDLGQAEPDGAASVACSVKADIADGHREGAVPMAEAQAGSGEAGGTMCTEEKGVKEKDFVGVEPQPEGGETVALKGTSEVLDEVKDNLPTEAAEHVVIPVLVDVPTTDPALPTEPDLATAMSRTASTASGAMTGTDTISTVRSIETRGTASSLTPRTYKARLVLHRRPGRKAHRLAIKVTRRPERGDDTGPFKVSRPPSRLIEPPPPPPSELTKDFAAAFSQDTLDQLNTYAKAYNTNGHLLPLTLRDFLPSIVDRQNAVQIANEVRQHLHLPLLSTRTDRVALQKALARMRERLYVELYAGLCLPLAPEPLQQDTKGEGEQGEEVERPSLSLTPSSLHHLSIHLPQVFPHDRAGIRAVFQSGMEYGEKGDVVWQAGVGHMARGKPGTGAGYRGELAEGAGGVHVFVDYSNILHGLLHALYSDPRPLPPRHARILSLPCLSLLLLRGRHISPGALHLVASSPLHQNMDTLVRLGWEVSIMKRVDIYEAEVVDYGAGKLVPRATRGVVEGPGGRREGQADEPREAGAKGSRLKDGRAGEKGNGDDVAGAEVEGDDRTNGAGITQKEEVKGKGKEAHAVADSNANRDRQAKLANGNPPQALENVASTADSSPKSTPSSHAHPGNGMALKPMQAPTPSQPRPTPAPPPPPPGPAPGLRRYKEQGVDEILTLKLLQTIYANDVAASPTAPVDVDTHNAAPNGHTNPKRPKPIGTIVLATGDARGGQFNAGGFLGAVRHAIKRGWAVELWSFASGLSRAWRETARREGWDGRFRVHTMDEWREWLVDVNEELVE